VVVKLNGMKKIKNKALSLNCYSWHLLYIKGHHTVLNTC